MNIFKAKSLFQRADQAAGRAVVWGAGCRELALWLGCVALLLGIRQAGAQDYSLDWWDADAGGTSAGGVYTVSGTIGQPEAGNLSGGFWGAVASVQIPGTPPTITITLTSTNTVLLTWPSPSAGFVLQQGANLNPSSWSNAGLKPTDDGTLLSVVLPSNPGSLFYRLKK